jgi:hypothetical protein
VLRHFSLRAASYLSMEGGGLQRKVELAEALGTRRVEGGKLEGESCWKSGGGRTRLYIWPRVGLADEAAIPDAAGGEGGHRAVKLDGVIHRHVFNLS